MIFSRNVCIPASTSPSDPQRATLTVTAGVVRTVFVRWRWGSANLCGVRVRYCEVVHWPYTLDEWIVSNTTPLEIPDNLLLDTAPFVFVIEAYNEDTRYPHMVWVGFDIMEATAQDLLAQMALLVAR